MEGTGKSCAVCPGSRVVMNGSFMSSGEVNDSFMTLRAVGVRDLGEPLSSERERRLDFAGALAPKVMRVPGPALAGTFAGLPG